MNTNPKTTRRMRHALSAVAAATLALAASSSWALGLGRMAVQSALGENLRAEIEITSLTPEEASSLRVRVAPAEAYRASGIDYNAVLQATQVSVARRPDGRPYLRLTSDRVVQEPFVDVILEITWSSGRLVREYTLLLDPPGSTRMATAPAPAPVAPAISPAPAAPAPRAAPPVAAAPAPAPRAAAAAPAPSTAPAAPRAAAGNIDEYRVRQGDTLSRVAQRTQREGVSLDQMLVALFRANPQAFIDENMNLLKAGSQLKVPSASEAKETGTAEAKQVIQAQSADFGAYRQRLASGVPAVRATEPARQATGRVSAQVDDKKAAASTTPDRLTLSQGGVKPGAPGEAQVSKATEQKAQTQRMAELSRNVEELKKLKDGAGDGKTPAAAPAAATAKPPVPGPTIAAAPPAPVPAPPAPAPAPAVTTPPAPAPVSTPPVAAATPPSAPAVVASAPAPEPAPAPVVAAASAPPEPASAPRPAVAAKPPAVPAEEPGFLTGLLDNPYMLPGAGLVIALLAGMGWYRWRSRSRAESGETSFLESRLQPDSFFGASGGQRIDTRDASGASSSMSYSLSQLDAIGDVDPVAEADVYLAYGRDLQAEEILKEAMRGNPERLAIRTKLLEVYAKRRDTKGYELLATQLYGLTGGDGDEWHKAQELGQSIDSDNPLYRPGGRPSAAMAAGAAATIEQLGASTMPQSVMPPQTSGFSAPPPAAPAPAATAPDGIDLDLDMAFESAPPLPSLDETQPLQGDAGVAPAKPSGDFTLPDVPPPKAATPAGGAMDFDLGGLSLDLGQGGSTPARTPAEPALDFGSVTGAAADDAAPIDASDPMARKLELAEEFRQIGDTEGARDLLEEVVSKASGSLKARAQSLLDTLA
ncbi:MAG TPA: FimV/HubP family polar landmark protein [Burkholderiaceae bacterium]|nr:FimV/HubP family polar landmark protein [Burkholderiaceae bacterium]